MRKTLPLLGVLCFLNSGGAWAGIPFKPSTRSVSSSGQFVIYCDDMTMRVAVSSFCEDTKSGILEMVGDRDVTRRDRWKIPIVINLLKPDPSAPNQPLVHRDMGNVEGGGRRIELDVVLRGNLADIHFQQQVAHCILLEMEYRDKGEFKPPTIDPPEWLVEGLCAYLRSRNSDVDVDVYKTLLDNSDMPTVEDFLTQTTDGMNASSLRLYQAYSFSFLQLLASLPDGQRTLGQYISDLPVGQDAPGKDLIKHFPALGGSPQSLQKWWMLSMARIAASDRFKGLSLEETEQRLAAALKFKIPTDKSGKTTKDFAIEDYKEFEKNPQAQPVLATANGSLQYLATQANPLYRPIVADYMMIVGELQGGKTRLVAEQLKEVGNYRAMVLKRMDAIADYMNWFEATQMGKRSSSFDDYLHSLDNIPVDTSKRGDALSQYLNSLEIQLQ